MIIEFEDNAWKELYLTEFTKDKNYKRLPKDIIKRFVKVVNYLRGARRVEDLFLIKFLHYEKKVGNLKDIEAVWVSGQYRLLFKSSLNEQGTHTNILLTKISKQYE